MSDRKIAISFMIIPLTIVGILVYHFAIREDFCDSIAVFDPKPDITAYETALILSQSRGWAVCVNGKHPMPEFIKRQFRFDPA
jgi:hypothetical protein